MNREEFFAQLAGLDEERLRKALWNLYWRGAAPVRERIEAEIAPVASVPRARTKAQPANPQQVLAEVREFVGLARAGAYLGGGREVSPKARSGWRFTFRRHAQAAREALAAEDPRPGEEAVAAIVDLACYCKAYQCFRSDDPMEAAKFIASDAVAALWTTMLQGHGPVAFAERAMPQLVRWESRHGWTLRGFGSVPEHETPLAAVLERLLPAPDAWVACAEQYVDALDRVAETQGAADRRGLGYSAAGYERKRRADDLLDWHDMLLERLPDYDAGHLLDKIAVHPALDGGHLLLFRARLALARGDLGQARALTTKGLNDLPGLDALHDLADKIGADVPMRAQGVRERRRITASPS
ncbi:hypothetical protein GCM10010121_074860 [Streptomyces brasiliensis]|uniref:Uncharacterized protein n=2 Tax=Streptomyces brasiliensis TaxID=1954 RepID=A0A917P1M4_9ACTN|nr:hypothetical protein GCM10010121_074860 [Streptomyces brasiliensis]